MGLAFSFLVREVGEAIVFRSGKLTKKSCTFFFLFLQAFIRDAEHVDSLSASHEAFLSNDDLGV